METVADRAGPTPSAGNETGGVPDEPVALTVRPERVNGRRLSTFRVVLFVECFVALTVTKAEDRACSSARARPGPSRTEAADPSLNAVLPSGVQVPEALAWLTNSRPRVSPA